MRPQQLLATFDNSVIELLAEVDGPTYLVTSEPGPEYIVTDEPEAIEVT